MLTRQTAGLKYKQITRWVYLFVIKVLNRFVYSVSKQRFFSSFVKSRWPEGCFFGSTIESVGYLGFFFA